MRNKVFLHRCSTLIDNTAHHVAFSHATAPYIEFVPLTTRCNSCPLGLMSSPSWVWSGLQFEKIRSRDCLGKDPTPFRAILNKQGHEGTPLCKPYNIPTNYKERGVSSKPKGAPLPPHKTNSSRKWLYIWDSPAKYTHYTHPCIYKSHEDREEITGAIP